MQNPRNLMRGSRRLRDRKQGRGDRSFRLSSTPVRFFDDQWFVDESDDAELPRVLGVLGVGIAHHHDNRELGPLLADPPQDLEAAHAGHDEVTHDVRAPVDERSESAPALLPSSRILPCPIGTSQTGSTLAWRGSQGGLVPTGKLLQNARLK
jgi:hypothetical protein